MVLGRAAGAAGQGSLSQRSRRLFRFHLSAAAGASAGDTQLFRQDTSLSCSVGSQRRRVVDDGPILQRDDRLGTDARAVDIRDAGLAYIDLRFRHVRSRTAEPGAAGDDAVRVLAAAAQPPMGRGKPVCAGDRDQGFPGGGVSLSALATAVGGGRRHGGLPRRFSVRRAGSGARLPAQRFRTEDMGSGNGGNQFGTGFRTAQRAELVVGQPIDHRGDAPADPPGQLQPGRSGASPRGT